MGWQRAAGRAEVYRALGCQRRECYSLSPRSRSSIPQLMRLPTQHMLASLRFHKIRCNASTERRRHPAPHRVRPRKVRGRALPFCPRAATRPHGAGEGWTPSRTRSLRPARSPMCRFDFPRRCEPRRCLTPREQQSPPSPAGLSSAAMEQGSPCVNCASVASHGQRDRLAAPSVKPTGSECRRIAICLAV